MLEGPEAASDEAATALEEPYELTAVQVAHSCADAAECFRTEVSGAGEAFAPDRAEPRMPLGRLSARVAELGPAVALTEKAREWADGARGRRATLALHTCCKLASARAGLGDLAEAEKGFRRILELTWEFAPE
ncbi:MAG: hypothetical protein LBQ12_15480 [Deltaproteobacteria bacterium]|jgi:hypothetical protein|nr:hypothetical protein [Deltaproteobacteria bacterium]